MAERRLNPFQEAMALAEQRRQQAVTPKQEVALNENASTEHVLAQNFTSAQKELAQSIANQEAVLAINSDSTKELLAQSSASTEIQVALPVASESAELVASGKVENIASTVASLLAHSDPSSRLVLAGKSASTVPRRTHFTPRGKSQLNIRIDSVLKAKLDYYTATSGQTTAAVVEEAIKHVLAHGSASLLAPFDNDDDLIKNPIIRLYCKYTGREFTTKDKADLISLQHLNPLILQIGMYRTLIQKTTKGKIQSFAYFRPEIEKAAEEFKNMEAPEDYVKHLARAVAKMRV